MPDTTNGNIVDLNVGKLLKRLEPFVTGPNTSHCIIALIISAKPKVAIARYIDDYWERRTVKNKVKEFIKNIFKKFL